MAQPELSSTGRPKRSVRPPARLLESKITDNQPKKRTQDANPAQRLQFILRNPKSPLTTMDIADLLNPNTWNMLSLDSRTFLSTLLPPTAFFGFQPVIGPHHPSRGHGLCPEAMDVDRAPSPPILSPDMLDTAAFSDPYFLAAAHTFQDHLYSGWLSDAHAEKVKMFKDGVKRGSLHAPWKDDVWESEHVSHIQRPHHDHPATSSVNVQLEPSGLAGEAAELKLVDLAKNGIIKVGDVIAYKRNFLALSLVIEKDVLIDSIHPKTSAITVILPSDTTQYLPRSLLLPDSKDSPIASTRSMVINSPTMLETGLLDIDGRVDKARRPNGNAWKSFTVWRCRDEAIGPDIEDEAGSGESPRAGRENHGTLFYLRGSYYQDR